MHSKLDAKITRAFHHVLSVYKERAGIDMRTAAYMVAVKRVAETMRWRGRPLQGTHSHS